MFNPGQMLQVKRILTDGHMTVLLMQHQQLTPTSKRRRRRIRKH